MKPIECQYEEEVLTAVSTRRWPKRVDEDLRQHVASCTICQDIVTVTLAFEEELESAPAGPALPESGLVWWRSQLRARQEAQRTAVRPITVAQAVAFAAAVGVAGALFGATASWFQRGLQWLGAAAGAVFSVQMPDVRTWVLTQVMNHSGLLATGMLVFLAIPLAVYLIVKWSERPA
jgi:hypothetical protein